MAIGGGENVNTYIEKLWNLGASEGYAAFKVLLAISRESDAVYPLMEQIIEKLGSDNSYIRTRALGLIVANAKWDMDCKIDENIDAILSHITDCKPITARQFIKDLPTLALDKPDLRQDILSALGRADTLKYPLSMRSLVDEDVCKAIVEIEHEERKN